MYMLNSGVVRAEPLKFKEGLPGSCSGGLGCTWTPKVCRIITFCKFWAIILPTFGGLARGPGFRRAEWVWTHSALD